MRKAFAGKLEDSVCVCACGGGGTVRPSGGRELVPRSPRGVCRARTCVTGVGLTMLALGRDPMSPALFEVAEPDFAQSRADSGPTAMFRIRRTSANSGSIAHRSAPATPMPSCPTPSSVTPTPANYIFRPPPASCCGPGFPTSSTLRQPPPMRIQLKDRGCIGRGVRHLPIAGRTGAGPG